MFDERDRYRKLFINETQKHFIRDDRIRFLSEADYASQIRRACVDLTTLNPSFQNESLMVQQVDGNWMVYRTQGHEFGADLLAYSVGRDNIRMGTYKVPRPMVKKLLLQEFPAGEEFDYKFNSFWRLEKLITYGLQYALIEELAKADGAKIGLWDLERNKATRIEYFVKTCSFYPESMSNAHLYLGLKDRHTEEAMAVLSHLRLVPLHDRLGILVHFPFQRLSHLQLKRLFGLDFRNNLTLFYR